MIFFTDLDGTIIRSASRKHTGDIVVEYKDGCEITCMPDKGLEMLLKIDLVIPVTSRSIEQYKRIEIPGFSPKYVITDNGGNLLVNGVPDDDWARWSREIANRYSSDITKCREILKNDPDRSFEIRLVDGLFLFTKSNDPQSTIERLAATDTALSLYNTDAKVYAIPNEINKGAAAERLIDIIGARGERIVCAGDGEMDVPMLEIANIALYPDDLNFDLRGYSCPRGDMCEFTAETVLRLGRRDK